MLDCSVDFFFVIAGFEVWQTIRKLSRTIWMIKKLHICWNFNFTTALESFRSVYLIIETLRTRLNIWKFNLSNVRVKCQNYFALFVVFCEQEKNFEIQDKNVTKFSNILPVSMAWSKTHKKTLQWQCWS